jgi:serine/threonine protein kinase
MKTNQGEFRWIALNDYEYMHHAFLLSLAVLQMILQLAVRLKELHALCYVHRDLKPGNVMWLPRENRWTVIDFGCVTPEG